MPGRDEAQRKTPPPNWAGLNEKERADLVGGIGRKWIADHPDKFLRLALIKGIGFLNPWPKHNRSGALPLVLGAYATLIMAGFAIGVFSLRLSNREHLFVLLLFFMYLGIDMVFMPATRHRMLYDPFFVLVGALPLARWRLRKQLEELSGAADRQHGRLPASPIPR